MYIHNIKYEALGLAKHIHDSSPVSGKLIGPLIGGCSHFIGFDMFKTSLW